MKLSKFLIIITIVPMMTLANQIDFTVNHIRDISCHSPAPDQSHVLVMFKKSNRVHQSNYLDIPVDGIATSYVHSFPIFAPDPSGDYEMFLNCKEGARYAHKRFYCMNLKAGDKVTVNVVCPHIKIKGKPKQLDEEAFIVSLSVNGTQTSPKQCVFGGIVIVPFRI